MTPANIDYLPAKYCLDRDFHYLFLNKDDWKPNIANPPELLDIYSDGYKFENSVGSAIYSDKLDLNIFLRLPIYCSVF